MPQFPDQLTEQTLQALPDAVVAVDQNGTVLFINSATETLTGYACDELCGLSVETLVPASRQSTHVAQRERFQAAPHSRATGSARGLQLLRKDGSLLPVDISLSPLDAHDGGVVISTIRDVSEQERRSKEEILLTELGALIGREHRIESVYEVIDGSLPGLIPFDRLTISTRVPDTDLVERVHINGHSHPDVDEGTRALSPDLAELAPGPLPGSSFAGSQETVTPSGSRFDKEGFQSWVQVSIGNPEVPFGYLSLRSFTKDAYTTRDLLLLERVADQIFPALENARLLTQVQAEARERTVLAEISRIITSTSEIETVYDQTAEQIRKLVPFDRIVLSTIDQSQNQVTIRYVAGLKVYGGEAGATQPLDEFTANTTDDTTGSRWLSTAEVEELGNRNPYFKLRTEAGLKSIVAAPLIWADEAIGILTLRSNDENAYGEGDATTVRKIANQISGAVANAVSAARTIVESEERAVLAEISRIITSTTEIEKVYELTTEQMHKLIQFDRIVVSTIDHNRNLVTDRYVAGLQVEGGDAGSTYSLDKSATGELSRTLHPLVFRDTSTHKISKRFPEMGARNKAGLRSLVTAPLIWNDRAIGLLTLRRREKNAYTEADAETAMKIARQISGAVASAELLLGLEDEVKVREVLAEISRDITSSPDISLVLPRVVTAIQRLMPVDRLVISDIDEERSEFSLRWSWGGEDGNLEYGQPTPISGRISEYVLKGSVATTIDRNTIAQYSTVLHPNSDKDANPDLKAWVAAPIYSGDKAVGILHIRAWEEASYTDREVRIVDMIGAQITGALTNAALYTRTRQEARERAALAEIGRVVNLNLDLQAVYESVEREVARLIPFDRIAIVSIDRERNLLWRDFVAGLQVEGLGVGTTLKLAPDVKDYGLDDLGPAIGVYDTEIFRQIGVRDAGLQSYLRAPLTIGGQRIGYLNLEHRSSDIFYPAHLVLLESIAAIIGPAIHNARLFEASRHEATERTAFAEIGRIINSATDIQETYQQFAAVLRNVIQVDLITISLITNDRQRFEHDFIWQSGNLPPVSSNVFDLAGSPVEQITDARSSVLLSSNSTSELIASYPTMGEVVRKGTNSGIGVPLVASDEVIGILSIGSADIDAYSHADVEKLERIGAQIAGALANAQSHAKTLESERARLSAEAATRELELLDEQRTNFLSTVSHELKTPLTSLIAFADILARNQDASMNDRQLQQISVMQRSARRLDLLINDLLDVSRLDAGTFTLTRSEFDLTVLIQEMGTAFLPLVDTNEQLLNISYPDGEFWIEADRDRIAQVMTNLLSNASKYSLPGAEIALAMEAGGESISITVTDSGIGMNQETLENVFTAFYRADDEHTLSQSGSGLGMMIVKNIVELHEGTITVSSKKGVGTTVRVVLPEYSTHPSAGHIEAERAALEPVPPRSRLE